MYAMQTHKDEWNVNICDEYKGYVISLAFNRFKNGQSTRGEIRVFNGKNDVTHLFSHDGISMITSVETILEIRQRIDSIRE